jgi:hypothetical protein
VRAVGVSGGLDAVDRGEVPGDGQGHPGEMVQRVLRVGGRAERPYTVPRGRAVHGSVHELAQSVARSRRSEPRSPWQDSGYR